MATASTPEMIKPKQKGKNKHHDHQQQIESKKEVFQNHSFIRIFYVRSKWSDTLELFGCIFLLIILHIVSCELSHYGLSRLKSIPSDAIFYRYQFLICLMISLIGAATGGISSDLTVASLQLAIQLNLLVGIERYYIPGKPSSKWWQTKSAVYFLILCIITLINLIITVEVGRLIFIGCDISNLLKGRFGFYRGSGLFCLIANLIMPFFTTSTIIKKMNTHLN